MSDYELICPCHFGMEAVLKKELTDLGYPPVRTEDGRVFFKGDDAAIPRANINLRTAERVLLKLGTFPAATYDELFEGVKALPWGELLPKDAAFPVVKASSVKSRLFSPSDIQSIVKKAAVEGMKKAWRLTWFPETGPVFPIRVFIHKDMAEISLDTTGDSLHKRGYRKLAGPAPIAENLAAAILLYSFWNKERILVDPFCGSGTFPIEAALIAANIAPGKNRDFRAMAWNGLFPDNLWKQAREEAVSGEDDSVRPRIRGYDIDGAVLETARKNAKDAAVEHLIHFQKRDVAQLSGQDAWGVIFANPPYGERMNEGSLQALYRTLGDRFKTLPDWSMYLITGYEGAEKALGLKAAKNRKLYNGMIKTYLYQFLGPKPPKRKTTDE